MKILNTLKAKIKNNWQLVSGAVALVTSTTTEITEIVLAWMPLIIVFAMLGMVLGMLKKFGKF